MLLRPMFDKAELIPEMEGYLAHVEDHLSCYVATDVCHNSLSILHYITCSYCDQYFSNLARILAPYT
jgi:hypothetical protein